MDFIVKEGLEVTAAINVCYDISDRETYSREISGLHEAMKYFGLREALLITAEAQPEEITDGGLKIKIVPFYQMGTGGFKCLGYPRLTPCRDRLIESGMTAKSKCLSGLAAAGKEFSTLKNWRKCMGIECMHYFISYRYYLIFSFHFLSGDSLGIVVTFPIVILFTSRHCC